MNCSNLFKFIRRGFRQAWRTYRQHEALHARFIRYKRILADKRFTCSWEDRWLCPDDATGTTSFDAHYMYHTAWATRILARTCPEKHVDIGSCLRFVTLASAFVPLDFYDFRPAHLNLSGLESKYANVTALPFITGSIPSLSCMHVVEHIGLERYGDHFDPQGDLKAMAELERVLALGGQLLFVVPIGGTARIQYNAHRIYRFDQITSYFKNLALEQFALITDKGEFIENAQQETADKQRYGCGCFLFTRKAPVS